MLNINSTYYYSSYLPLLLIAVETISSFCLFNRLLGCEPFFFTILGIFWSDFMPLCEMPKLFDLLILHSPH